MKFRKIIIWIVIWVIVTLLLYYKKYYKNNERIELDPPRWYEEELALRQYDLDLCKNKDEYEKYLDSKYNVIDLDDFFDKAENYDEKDKETYYYIATYDMIHSNELDTCVAVYKLRYILPEEDPNIEWFRKEKMSRYIVDSKNDEILWEKTTDFWLTTSHDEVRSEFDKYRDNLTERQDFRERKTKASEAYSIDTIIGKDGYTMIDIEATTQSLFNKPYNSFFSDEEKIEIQKVINENLWYHYTRYVVRDWPYSWWGIEIIDPISENIQTVDIASIYLFTAEDYTYNYENSERVLTYMENIINPSASKCFTWHEPQNIIECPNEMHPIEWTKMCFDLLEGEYIDCRLIKF